MKALVVSSLLLIAAVSAHAQSSYQQTYNATRDAIQSAQLVQDSLNRANAPKQYTQADLSTDAGRKVYLMEHPQYPNQYSGTDGARKLQEDADKLAGKPSGGQGLYALLKPANPSLTSDDLKSMGSPTSGSFSTTSTEPRGNQCRRPAPCRSKWPSPRAEPTSASPYFRELGRCPGTT